VLYPTQDVGVQISLMLFYLTVFFVHGRHTTCGQEGQNFWSLFAVHRSIVKYWISLNHPWWTEETWLMLLDIIWNNQLLPFTFIWSRQIKAHPWGKYIMYLIGVCLSLQRLKLLINSLPSIMALFVECELEDYFTGFPCDRSCSGCIWYVVLSCYVPLAANSYCIIQILCSHNPHCKTYGHQIWLNHVDRLHKYCLPCWLFDEKSDSGRTLPCWHARCKADGAVSCTPGIDA
jgi:hypothetical protein